MLIPRLFTVFHACFFEFITWNAEGITRLKTGLVSFFIIIGSHKCAYPTDIELSSDRMNLLLYPSVFPNFPAAIRTNVLYHPSQLSVSALDHSATVKHFQYQNESRNLLWNLSARHD